MRALLGAMLVGVALMAGHAFTGLGSANPEVYDDWIFSATIIVATLACVARVVLVRDERRAWFALACGLVLYSIGTVLWSFWIDELASPPFPSLADPLWLALYVAGYLAIGLLIRARVRRFERSVWLDGLIAALAVAAIGVAFVYDAVVANSVGTTAAIATNLAYPFFDLLLAAVVTVVFALAGWRPGMRWVYLGSGFILLALADGVFVNQVADGTYVPGGLANFLWVAGIALMGVAAWTRSQGVGAGPEHGWSSLLVPAFLTLTASGLLLYDHFSQLNLLSVALAAATLVAAVIRTVLAFRELRSLAESRTLALTDELTGLPNRRCFSRDLRAALAGEPAGVTVLIIDLDHFKELNDTLGHHAGDLLLRDLGPRLREVIGVEDLLARLGGDEFAILMRGCDREAAAEAARRVRGAISEPFVFQDLHLIVEASVGIALGPEDGREAEDLVRHADIAMYQAKSANTGEEFYVAARDEHSRSRLALTAELRTGIAEGQLVLHYQPKYDVRTGAVPGVEALVRWQHPRLGLLPPGEFLELAERSGLMRRLTHRVLETALETSAGWRRRGLDLGVAVNLATPNLLDAQLPDDVEDLLERWNVPAEMLVLEITEDTIMADPVRTMDLLARLGELGVHLSLDDFGTGRSSLAYLRRLPVEEMKVDRGFTTNFTTDSENAAIVRTVIQLGHSLRLRVVAEGVEDQETQDQLAALGCDLVQGFHIAAPMPADELERWVRSLGKGSDTSRPAGRLAPSRVSEA